MDSYTIIILLTLFGFLALAAALLVPVYRFLRREEQASRRWMSPEVDDRRTDSAPSFDDTSSAANPSSAGTKHERRIERSNDR